MSITNNEINYILDELKTYETLRSEKEASIDKHEACFDEMRVHNSFEKDIFETFSAEKPVIPGNIILGKSEYDGFTQQVQEQTGNMKYIDIFVKLVIIIFALSTFSEIKGIGWLLGLAAAAFLVYLFFVKKIMIVKTTNKTAKNNKDSYNNFNYQVARQNFIDACKEYDTAFSVIPQKFEEYISLQNKNAQKASDEYDSAKSAIDEFFKHTKYLTKDTADYAWRIAECLENGRASDYKEALNLAIDDCNKELQERHRQEEAERQEELLRQQNRALGIDEYGYRIR